MSKTNRDRNRTGWQPLSWNSPLASSSASLKCPRSTQRGTHPTKPHSSESNGHDASRKPKTPDKCSHITKIAVPFLLAERFTKALPLESKSFKATRKRRVTNKSTQTVEDNSNPHEGNSVGDTFQTEATKTEVIGNCGGSIELYGCKVDFPRYALKQDTEVQLSIDNDSTKFPKKGIPITPVISVKPHMAFDVPVKVSMKTSCKAKKGEATAQVWSRESVDDDWKEYKKVQLGSENIVKFTVNHFSGRVATVADSKDIIHTVYNRIFIMQEEATLSSVFYSDDKSINDASKRYQELDYVIAKPVDLIMEGKAEDIYQIEVNCVSPEYMEYESKRGNPAEFKLSRKFIRTRKPIAIEFYSKAAPENGTKKLRFDYSVQLRDGEEDLDNDCSFEIKWPVKTKNHGPKTNITVSNSDVHSGKISDSTVYLHSGS